MTSPAGKKTHQIWVSCGPNQLHLCPWVCGFQNKPTWLSFKNFNFQ